MSKSDQTKYHHFGGVSPEDKKFQDNMRSTHGNDYQPGPHVTRQLSLNDCNSDAESRRWYIENR